MTLYSKLKDWCDDDPDAILQLAVGDEQFQRLCMQVLDAAEELHDSEKCGRQLYATPVDPKFLSAWRDYEARYEQVLGATASWGMMSIASKGAIASESRWKHADFNGKIAADIIDKVIEFARDKAIDDDLFDFGHGMSAEQTVEMAIDYWESLKDEIGFDLADVFRRRMLVPFVFFPRHVAGRHNTPEKTFIYQCLQQAHDAFIFGVPFAALALMRSLMEKVLRDHYNAQGNDLSERINSVRKILPAGANAAELHQLRLRANIVMHGSTDGDEIPMQLEPIQSDREFVRLLLVLRALIEGVPQRRLGR